MDHGRISECPTLLYLPAYSCFSHLEHRGTVKRVFQFTVGRIPWTGDQPDARPLATQTQNKHKQTFMPCVGFEPTISAFERAKTFHVLHCAATVIGPLVEYVWGQEQNALVIVIRLQNKFIITFRKRGKVHTHTLGYGRKELRSRRVMRTLNSVNSAVFSFSEQYT
jgi:hypothetical protein